MKNVFLYGTMDQAVNGVDSDHWRKPFMNLKGINAYNPFVANWTPDDAKNEAEALRTADLVVMNITLDNYSLGSLAESGWIYAECKRRNIPFLVRVEQYSDDLIKYERERQKNNPEYVSPILLSHSARVLCAAHMKEAENYWNKLFVIDDFSSLLEIVVVMCIIKIAN